MIVDLSVRLKQLRLDKQERINNASTPMFLVEGHKGCESPLTMRYELGQ